MLLTNLKGVSIKYSTLPLLLIGTTAWLYSMELEQPLTEQQAFFLPFASNSETVLRSLLPILKGKQLLQEAARSSNQTALEFLLINGEPINQKDAQGKTALHHAVESGDVPMVQTLLGAGADANALDMRERSPLHHAVMKDHQAIAKLLLEADSNVNAMYEANRNASPYVPINDNQTPLHCAIENRNLAMVRWLTEEWGADVNCGLLTDPFYQGKFHDVDEFLNHPRCTYYSPLYAAVYVGEPEIVQFLLEKKAMINVCRERDGLSLLHLAVNLAERSLNNYKQIIKALVEAGLSVDSLDHEKRTPLLNLLSNARSTHTETLPETIKELLTLLLELGADVTVKNRHGYAPTDLWAKRWGSFPKKA